jgi:hypothetical protein
LPVDTQAATSGAPAPAGSPFSEPPPVAAPVPEPVENEDVLEPPKQLPPVDEGSSEPDDLVERTS